MKRKCPKCGAKLYLQLNDIIINTTTYEFTQDGKVDPKTKETSFEVMEKFMPSVRCTECNWRKRVKFTK